MLFSPFLDMGNRGLVSWGACTKIHLKKKQKQTHGEIREGKALSGWWKVLNVLFRMSEEVSDRDEIESTYSKFHSYTFTGKQPFSHLSGKWKEAAEMSLLTVICSLEHRRRVDGTGAPSLINSVVKQRDEYPPPSIVGSLLTRDQVMEAAAIALNKCSPWQQRFAAAKCLELLIWYSTTLTNQVCCVWGWDIFASADLVVA